jgi:hypothetical protein
MRPDRIFPAQRESRCASGATTVEWRDVEICREMLDKTTCPVPSSRIDPKTLDIGPQTDKSRPV